MNLELENQVNKESTQAELSYINDELVLGRKASADFLAIEEYMRDKNAESAFYEDDAHIWLESLVQTRELLACQDYDTSSVMYGIVKNVIRPDSVIRSKKNHLREMPTSPDFIVIMQHEDEFLVGGYEVKSTAFSRSVQAKKRIQTGLHAMVHLITTLPDLENQIKGTVNTDPYALVQGQLLFPGTPRNRAVFDTLEQYKIGHSRFVFPSDTSVFPYALRRFSQDKPHKLRIGQNVSLFPLSFPPLSDNILTLCETFHVDPEYLSTIINIRKKLTVNTDLARRTHLKKNSQIELGIPYVINELLWTVEQASVQFQQDQGLIDLPFDQFVSRYSNVSFFDFLDLLQRDFVNKPQEPKRIQIPDEDLKSDLSSFIYNKHLEEDTEYPDEMDYPDESIDDILDQAEDSWETL